MRGECRGTREGAVPGSRFQVPGSRFKVQGSTWNIELGTLNGVSPDTRHSTPVSIRYTSAPMHAAKVELVIGLVSISDRASQGVYQDEGIPALVEWFAKAVASPHMRTVTRLIPDERPVIEATLKELVDRDGCHLVLTTGGTGPAARHVTPEATLAVADKVMPGFGEQMRQVSLRFVPTAILSRQVAVIRKSALIINLPGQPKAIRETLEGLKDENGKPLVHGIFAAVPYCIDLIGGADIHKNGAVCKAFRAEA